MPRWGSVMDISRLCLLGISKLCLLATLALACATAGRPVETSARPGLQLRALDGSVISLEQLWRDRAATVLVFWSTQCPCVRRYQGRVDDLAGRYPPERVRVVGISSNAGEDYATVLRVAAERGIRIPIFRDETGDVARALGASSTPTTAVLDGQGRLRFLGWIDNEHLPGDSDREPWLERAIDGVLENRAFTSRTPVYGCTITRSLFGPSSTCCRDQH